MKFKNLILQWLKQNPKHSNIANLNLPETA